MKYTLDTNIIIAYLNGDFGVKEYISVLRETDAVFFVSTITLIELLAYPAMTEGDEKIVNNFLSNTTLVDCNVQIARGSALIRRKYRVPLGDSAVAATALQTNSTVLTRDREHFERLTDLLRIEFI